MKHTGSYVVFWLEGLNAVSNTTTSNPLDNATNVLRYDLPVYGYRERSLCDYYIESFVFFFCLSVLSRFIWVVIVRVLKPNQTYLFNFI